MKLTLNILKKEECSRGGIGRKETKLTMQIDEETGEFHDLLCVALRKKPLATFDYTEFKNIQKVKKWLPNFNKKLVNEIIEFSNEQNIKGIYFTKKINHYLKTIFYYPHQRKNAYKLAYILWSGMIDGDKLPVPYFIGILLGYTTHNIKQFYLKNYNVKISDEDDKKIKKILREINNYEIWVNNKIKNGDIKKLEYIDKI